jgi:hypothetical protein
MQSSKVLRSAFRASRIVREGDARAHALQIQSAPHLKKTWKSYSYKKGERTQQLSPYEIDILGPLFRNIGEKLKHKVEDNIWDVAPPILFYMGLVWTVKEIRKDILYHHRA